MDSKARSNAPDELRAAAPGLHVLPQRHLRRHPQAPADVRAVVVCTPGEQAELPVVEVVGLGHLQRDEGGEHFLRRRQVDLDERGAGGAQRFTAAVETCGGSLAPRHGAPAGRAPDPPARRQGRWRRTPGRARRAADRPARPVSPGCGPLMAASIGHRSATPAATTPGVSSVGASPRPPVRLIRPRFGLMPATPQNAAGMRTEPPVSLATAAGTMPAATAAADPPLEPPGTRSRFHGLRGLDLPGVLGGDAPAELVRAGDAHDHRTRRPQAPHQLGVDLGDPPRQHLRAVVADGTGHVEQLLDPHRHAVQRPPGLTASQLGGPLGRLGRRPFGGYLRERTQCAVEALDPLEGCRQNLGRVGVPGRVQRSEARNRQSGSVQVAVRASARGVSPRGSRGSPAQPRSRPARTTAPRPAPRGSPCPRGRWNPPSGRR